MKLLQKLITEKKPFAVIKYKERMIGQKSETNVAYELIVMKLNYGNPYFANGVQCRDSETVIIGTVLTEQNVKYFKQVRNELTKVFENENGAVWEMYNFQKLVKENQIKY